MTSFCKGKCKSFKAESIANGLKYTNGLKWCRCCSVFLMIEGLRCPCCHYSLRLKPKIRTNLSEQKNFVL